MVGNSKSLAPMKLLDSVDLKNKPKDKSTKACKIKFSKVTY
jgi:hypothetical protein